MKIVVTNTSPVDIIIDINGQNDTKDKVIIHPKTTVELLISDSVYSDIKSTKGLVVNLQN